MHTTYRKLVTCLNAMHKKMYAKFNMFQTGTWLNQMRIKFKLCCITNKSFAENVLQLSKNLNQMTKEIHKHFIQQ